VLVVAHRTPSSRSACERLAAAGAQVFEADVQIDAHDRIVVSHFLPFGRYGLVQRDNWRLRWHSAAARDPQLLAVAAIVPDQCLVLLDLKEKATDRRARLVSAIAGSLADRTRFRVCGPCADDLAQLRDAGFRTWRTVGDRRELATVLAEGRLADDAVTVRQSLLDAHVVDRLHEAVPAVVAWTVNDRGRAGQLRGLRVDGVTTDRVAIMRLLAAA
jgi:glycerophosphoryl diester phosphodiesterase